MHTNFSKLSFLIVGIFFVFPGVAEARPDLSLQGRFEPVSIGDNAAQGAGDTGLSFGLRNNRLILRATLAMQSKSQTSSEKRTGADFRYSSESEQSFRVITPGVQVQYYLAPPEAKHVVPFVTARVGKAFAFESDKENSSYCSGSECSNFDSESANAIELAQQEFARSILSPWVVSAGAGVEFFVVESLSIGLEGGARVLYATASIDARADGQSLVVEQSTLETHLFYGTFTLNYFW